MTDPHFHAHWSPWLRLVATPGIGAFTAAKLLRHFGDACAIFSAPKEAIAARIGPQKSAALAHPPAHFAEMLERTRQWLQSPAPGQQRAIWSWLDPQYPPDLLETPDPPALLFAQGAAQWLATESPLWHSGCTGSIAIVGSRSPSQQGQENARQLAAQLQEMGLSIVSGMALGIDAAAHEGALRSRQAQTHPPAPFCGPPTIAVLGTGMDCIYPRQNTALYHALSAQALVLSEHPIGTPAQAHNFPKRNRIITGITQGTLVIEAALQSGSLISARLAAEQGKEVFAIPGSIHAPQSKGCHQLLKQGAKLVEDCQDILDELPMVRMRIQTAGLMPCAPAASHPAPPTRAAHLQSSARAPVNTQQARPPDLASKPMPSAPEAVLQAIGFAPCGLDTLMARTGMNASTLQTHLLELELAGALERLPGGLFQQLVRC